ncbi:thermonuclease family protein [Corallincola platygyrae]|uniref:Thermonuclease family protein n=1 Tax=Corallincola platygyrae TaxID=1193278 RepID=A0ABW4XNT0_9GAMM
MLKFLFTCVASLLLFSPLVLAVPCIPVEYNDSGFVKTINDGDTFTLQDGRRIRLVGIDAPEVDHLQPEKSQPLAVPAKELLTQLLPAGTPVKMRLDLREKDKYGRTLAVVVNQSNINVSEVLIKAGLARPYWIPPNYFGWRCYQLHEREARAQRVGLWGLPVNQPRSAVSVLPEQRRQVDVVGKITKVEESAKTLWLVLDNRIYVGIAKEHLPLFEDLALRAQLMETVRITGKVYQAYDKLRMTLEHPWQLAFIEKTIPVRTDS